MMKTTWYGIRKREEKRMQIDEGRLLNLKVKNVERGNLISKDWCKRTIKRLVDATNMKAISQPMCVVYYDKENSENDGVSGVVIISTSHISLHAWLENKAIDITVNSCKDFSTSKVIEFCKEEFFTEDVFINVDVNKGGN